MASLSMSSPLLKWTEHPPGVWEAIGSNSVGDSDFFFVPRSWHADYFIFTSVLFHIYLLIYLWESDRITPCVFFKTIYLILVKLYFKQLQAVRRLALGGKFYRLPPDKENTENLGDRSPSGISVVTNILISEIDRIISISVYSRIKTARSGN